MIVPARKAAATWSIGGFCAVLLCGSASGASLYKWVDAEGKTHYGDRPGTHSAKPLALKPSPPNRSEPRKINQQKLLDAFAAEREEKKRLAAEAQQKEEKREKNCIAARQQLSEYQEASFLYERDQAGNRTILDDKEHARVLQAAKESVERWCG